MPMDSNANIQYSLRLERPVNSAYLLSGKVAQCILCSLAISSYYFQSIWFSKALQDRPVGVESTRRVSPKSQLQDASIEFPNFHGGKRIGQKPHYFRCPVKYSWAD